MSAYFHTVLRKLHEDTKKDLELRGIKLPRRGRKELERVNKELKRELRDEKIL